MPYGPDAPLLVGHIIERYRSEGFDMPYTMANFKCDVLKEYLPKLTAEERQEVVQSLPLAVRRELLGLLLVEEMKAGLSPEQIQQYLDQLTAGRSAAPRKPRRKK